MMKKDKKPAAVQSVLCGMMIGFICGFVGAGGGMMMLFVLTSVLGYELKTAVGTSVFIMSFTALTGAASHFIIDKAVPDIFIQSAYRRTGKKRSNEASRQSKAQHGYHHYHAVADMGLPAARLKRELSAFAELIEKGLL